MFQCGVHVWEEYYYSPSVSTLSYYLDHSLIFQCFRRNIPPVTALPCPVIERKFSDILEVSLDKRNIPKAPCRIIENIL
jgi:hypothetical protein